MDLCSCFQTNPTSNDLLAAFQSFLAGPVGDVNGFVILLAPKGASRDAELDAVCHLSYSHRLVWDWREWAPLLDNTSGREYFLCFEGKTLDATDTLMTDVSRILGKGWKISFQQIGKVYEEPGEELEFRDNPNPIDSVTNISRITIKLQQLQRMLGRPAGQWHDDLSLLIQRTALLPSVPTGKIFGMYLENFGVFDPASTRLRLASLFTYTNPQGKQLILDIYKILNDMSNSYIHGHTYHRVEMYRLLRRFVELSKMLLAAAYATPSLASGFWFSETITKLDNFTWELARIERSSDKTWSIPRWADLREHCDFVIEGERHSVFSIAVFNVAEIVGAYAGEPLPQFQNMPKNIAVEMRSLLLKIQTLLDPFDGERAWEVLGLIRGKAYNYYLPGGKI